MSKVDYKKSPIHTVGYVYIVCDNTGLVKIGSSTNPTKRISAIRTSSGREITHWCISDMHEGYRETERALHAKFNDYRTVGEWFQAPFDDVALTLSSMDIEHVTEDRVEQLIRKAKDCGESLCNAIIFGFGARGEKSSGAASEFISDGATRCSVNRSAIEVTEELFTVVPGLDDYIKQYIISEATLVDLGTRLIALPKNPENSRTIPELADELGVHPSEIAKFINKNKLLASGEYGGFDSQDNFYATKKGADLITQVFSGNTCH